MAAQQESKGGDLKIGAIRPTLFLGLGGTGKEVLLRLRRKFFERMGVFGLPCTSYLWLDTDTRDRLAFGEGIDETFSSVAFQPHETISLLGGSVGSDLSQIWESKDQWKHVHRWLPKEVERYGREIADGAGGVRSVGRLTYFQHFADKINPLLGDALDKVRSHNSIDRTKEFFAARKMGAPDILDSATQVVLVSSLAGGTGCGTFLDAAFHLGLLAEKGVSIDRVIGVLFLPNVFYPNAASEVAQRSFGNAYAALKELEFYTLRVNKAEGDLSCDFEVEWESGQERTIKGPPFSIGYLLEMKNEGGTPLETRHRAEMFNVVSESLFLDFMPGEFSTAKRSHYSNIAQQLAGTEGANISFEDVTLPQVFARRYASFGMSKVEIPVDQVKASCASYLAYEIASYINRETEDPRIGENVRDDMARRGFDDRGLMARFGNDWKDAIREHVAKAVPQAGVVSVEKIDEIETRLGDLETRMIYAEGKDPVRWGSVIGTLRKQVPQISQKACEDVLQWVKDCLENDVRGLKSLIADDGYFRFMAEYLKDLYAAVKEGSVSALDQQIRAAEGSAKYYRTRKEGTLNELREAVRSTGLAVLARKDSIIEHLLLRLRDAEEQYCKQVAARCVFEGCKTIAAAMVEDLTRRRKPLEAFSVALAGAAQSFHQSHESSLSFAEAVLLIRFFDRAGDWDKFYRLDANEQGHLLEVEPRAEYNRFLTHGVPAPASGAATLWDVVELFNRKGDRELRRRMAAHSEARFWADFEANPREVDILSHPQLTEKYQTTIEKLVRAATPLARRVPMLGGKNVQVRKLAYLGIPKVDGAPYEAFIEDVKNALAARGMSANDVAVQPTGKPWEIYLYMVTYAFPLSSLTVVTQECHDAYQAFYRSAREQRAGEPKHQIPLHLSREWEGKFEDLRAYFDKTAEEIMTAREVLLFGPLLRVLGVSESQGRAEYDYNSGRPHFKQKVLGTRREAVDFLQNNATQRDAFRMAISGTERILANHPDRLLTYFWALHHLAYSGKIQQGSAEATMIDRKLTVAEDRLLQLRVDPSLLDIQQVKAEAAQRIRQEITFDSQAGTSDAQKAKAEQKERAKVAEVIREYRLTDGVEWSGDWPMLTSIEVWTPTAAAR